MNRTNTVRREGVDFNLILAEETRSDDAPFLNSNQMIVVKCIDPDNQSRLLQELLTAGFALR